MEDSSGKLLLRLPKDLHHELSKKATENSTSLNSYILYLLSKGLKETSAMEKQGDTHFRTESVHIYGGETMGQNTDSGRLGNEFGRFLGKAIAQHLGIELETGTNKGIFKNRSIVIKSARKKNTQFGITNRMLDEIQDVIVAKESSEGVFDLYIVPIESIINSGRAAGGKNKNKVTNFSVASSISNGIKIGAINIEPY